MNAFSNTRTKSYEKSYCQPSNGGSSGATARKAEFDHEHDSLGEDSFVKTTPHQKVKLPTVRKQAPQDTPKGAQNQNGRGGEN